MEPAYSFTIPSVGDDLTLDCRIYHPECMNDANASDSQDLKGTVIAHPYAPLGGSYDDPVVFAVAETMLNQGYVVATSNFRGAAGSAGKTTWTGRAETEDYVSVAGFTIYYLYFLLHSVGTENTMNADPRTLHDRIDMVLAGYSYGSLVLAKLPAVSSIVQRFHEAAIGTSPAEIVMRARTLAEQTRRTLAEQQSQAASRGRSLNPGLTQTLSPSKHQMKPFPVTVGGEETDPSQRRSSRDSRRSVDVVRQSVEVPRKIRAHLRKHSGQVSAETTADHEKQASPVETTNAPPNIRVRYLLVSPVVLPFTTTLCPPGSPALTRGPHKKDPSGKAAGSFSQHSTLAVFGSSDSFTASRTLRAWAERQAKDSTGSSFEWKEIDHAGHFWREQGVMLALQERVTTWLDKSPTE